MYLTPNLFISCGSFEHCHLFVSDEMIFLYHDCSSFLILMGALLLVIGSRMLMEIVARVTPAERHLLMIFRLRLDFGCDHEFDNLTAPQSSTTATSKFYVIPSWSEAYSSWRKWNHTSSGFACKSDKHGWLSNTANTGNTIKGESRAFRARSLSGLVLISPLQLLRDFAPQIRQKLQVEESRLWTLRRKTLVASTYAT